MSRPRFSKLPRIRPGIRPGRVLVSLIAAGAGLALPSVASAANYSPQIAAVSCPSSGSCMAVGNYSSTPYNPSGLMLSEYKGVWAYGLRPSLPADASLTPNTNLDAISCASAGNCSAVGNYANVKGAVEGLLDSSSGYWWKAAVTARLPSGVKSKARVNINGVSCWSSGNCLAVGDYRNNKGAQEAISWTETNGAWARGVAMPLPANAGATHGSSLSSVSCTGTRQCSVSGWYTTNASTTSIAGLVDTYAKGKLGTGLHVTLPAGAAADPEVDLPAISCATAGTCTAVGNYTDIYGQQLPFEVNDVNGSWQAGALVPLPSSATTSNPYAVAATSSQVATLDSVSCNASDVCAAGGSYTGSGATDPAYQVDPLVLYGSGGVLSTGVAPTLPADATNKQNDTISSVGCDANGDCLAVGNDMTTGEHSASIELQESGGVWSAATEPVPPSDSATSYSSALGPVACAANGGCEVVDDYNNAAGNQEVAFYGATTTGAWPAAIIAHPLSWTATAARNALNPLRRPDGGHPTRKQLIAASGASFSYTSYGPAKLRVTWTAVTNAGTKRRPRYVTVTVASSNNNWFGEGVHPVAVKLTAAGRKVLAGKKPVVITARLSLSAEGAGSYSPIVSFTAS